MTLLLRRTKESRLRIGQFNSADSGRVSVPNTERGAHFGSRKPTCCPAMCSLGKEISTRTDGPEAAGLRGHGRGVNREEGTPSVVNRSKRLLIKLVKFNFRGWHGSVAV